MSGKTKATGGVHLRITLGGGFAVGPGKADLLEGIHQTGSIAAAGRRMKMSYKRAWSLVESMNAAFREPLVTTSRGGSDRGGAALTKTGEAVLESYRRMQELARNAIGDEIEKLNALVAGKSDISS